MRRRDVAAARIGGAVLVGLVSLADVSVAGQAPPEAGTVQFRTAWGHPDLQGVWTNKTITPFERPDELKGQESTGRSRL